jgi:hypothetical protein
MDKRGKTWQSMSISNEVFDKLDIMRERTEGEMGMKLSWTKFFSHMLREFERVSPKPPVKPAVSAK